MHEFFNSGYSIPISAFALAFGIVLVTTLNRYHIRKLQSEERMAAIARGLPFSPEPVPEPGAYDPKRNAAKSRTGGIVLIGVGLGIIVGLALISWVVQVREALAGCIGGIIPLFIGIGMLVDYMLQTRDIRRAEARAPIPQTTHES